MRAEITLRTASEEPHPELFDGLREALDTLKGVLRCGCTFGDCPVHEDARALLRKHGRLSTPTAATSVPTP